MREGTLQKMYEGLRSKRVRIAVLKSANLFGFRHLLVRMDTNNICDLRCEMCPEVQVRKSSGFKPVIMPLDDFKRVAGQVFAKAHVLYISCAGEPLLTPRFQDYVRVAGLYRVPFLAFITNGMRLTADVVKACMDSGVAQIAVSADGATAPTFEAVRTGGSFSRLLDNLDMIRDMKRNAASKKPEVRLNYTIGKPNWHEVVEFMDLAREYGAGSVQFRPLTPFLNNPWSEANQLSEKEKKELARLFITVEDRSRDYGIKLLGHGEFTGTSIQEKGSIINTCVYPWFYRYIHSDGRIMLCARRKPVGNLLRASYAEIMKSDAVRGIKRDVLTRGDACRIGCSAGVAATEL